MPAIAPLSPARLRAGSFSRHRSLLLTALLAGACPVAVAAQSTAPRASEKPATSGAAEIIVSGERPAAVSSIDRKSYQVSRDLQSAAGGASDVLRSIPSVDIDAQGAISLRGDTNVQILIDGKPSTTMSGATRADALEQFPASAIDHIEVITNPSAQYKPDGSGGIINIVTRKDRKPGTTGTVQASGGTDRRFSIGGNASHHAGPLTINLKATLRRDVRWRPFTDHRVQTDPATGAVTTTDQESIFHGPKMSHIVGGGIDYDLDRNDRLSTSGSYNLRTGQPRLSQHDLVSSAAGVPINAFDRSGAGDEREVSDEVSAKYRHSFAGKGHAFTLDLRRGESIENERRRFANIYSLPAGLVTIDQQQPRIDLLQRELAAEYTTPFAGGKLLTGYDVQRDNDDFLNRGILIDPVTGTTTVDPAKTNRFAYRQTVHAWYATYDHALGRSLSAIAGARVEDTIIDTSQVDLGLRSHQSYVRFYPTLHLQYDLGDGRSAKLSYSHRLVRPDPEDLNPYPVFSDPLNQRAGNADLKPQETDAFEAGFQVEGHGNWEATAFLRKNRNVFTDVSRLIAGNILLSTKDNLGKSTSAGLDFSGSGRLSAALSWRISGSVYHSSINASNLGIAGTRSAWIATAKGGADYQLARRDVIQLSVNYNGKRLTPQGYRLPSIAANLGYRHRFDNGITAVLSVSDIFKSQRERNVINGATFVENSTRRNTRRYASLALSMPFGGGKRSDEPKFDYGEGGGG